MFYIQPAGVQVWVPEQQPVQSLAAAPVEHPLGVHRHAGAAVVAGVVVVVTEEVQVEEAMVEQVYTWVANIHLYSTVQYSTEHLGGEHTPGRARGATSLASTRGGAPLLA